MSNEDRSRHTWWVGLAACGGGVLGVVSAAGATQPPAVSASQAGGAEVVRLDQQVLSLGQQEEILQRELWSSRHAATATVQPASPDISVLAPVTAQPPPATTPTPAPAAVAPQPGPAAAVPTTSPPADDQVPTPTSVPAAPATTQPPASTTTTTHPPTTTTTRPRHGGGGGSGD